MSDTCLDIPLKSKNHLLTILKIFFFWKSLVWKNPIFSSLPTFNSESLWEKKNKKSNNNNSKESTTKKEKDCSNSTAHLSRLEEMDELFEPLKWSGKISHFKINFPRYWVIPKSLSLALMRWELCVSLCTREFECD